MGDEKHWLKPDEVEAMRDAAHEGRHPQRDDAIITLLYDTGLRRNELAHVNREMFALEDGLLRLPTSVHKDYPNDITPPPVTFELDRDSSLRTVATLREFLEARVDDDPSLVPSQKAGRMTGKGINDVVQRAARRAGVRPYCFSGRGRPEDISAHTLRHSVAWRMLRIEGGNTLYDVRNRLRHASLLTTEREYDHFETI